MGGWDRNETPYLGPVRGGRASRCGSRLSRRLRTAGRCSSRARTRAWPGDRARISSPSSSPPAPAIVVAGAHGKTTTAAMIAFALRETGRDPSWVVGGEVPQLGANAGAGEGWLVVEGDESDRSVAALRPRIAVVTNVDLDHHAEFGSRAEVEELFARWLAEVPEVVRGWELEPVRRSSSPCRGSTTAGTPRRRWPRWSGPAFHGEEAAAALARSEGVGRRFQRVGEAGGVGRLRRLRPQPGEARGRRSRPRAGSPATAGCSFSSSRTCTRGRVTWRPSSGGSSPPRTRSPSPTSIRPASSRCRA